MDEIDSRDLEQAWPDLALKLEELHAQLPPLEPSESRRTKSFGADGQSS